MHESEAESEAKATPEGQEAAGVASVPAQAPRVCDLHEEKPPHMSKNALKRALKQQRFAETRDQWKAYIKEKKKLKKLARKEAWEREKREVDRELESVGGSDDQKAAGSGQREEKHAPEGEVIIDLAFKSLMSEREIACLAPQICRTYAINKRTTRPYNLVVTGLDGPVKEHLSTSFPQHEKWKIDLRPEPLEKYITATKNSVVYLCANGTDALTTIDPDTTYVIGGLVDRNRRPFAASSRAYELKFKTARLPLSDHIRLRSSEVLSIVHVFEIMCKYRELGSWTEAINAVIPERKKVA